MLLHEFMRDHREEILAACHVELRDAERTDLLPDYVRGFFDETRLRYSAIPARATPRRHYQTAAKPPPALGPSGSEPACP